METVHELKTLPEYYEAACLEKKKAEFRKNDRDFKVGDTLLLREWVDGDYTERYMDFTITHITDCKPFINDDYVMLSIERVEPCQ